MDLRAETATAEAGGGVLAGTALITGGARRVGSAIARALHGAGLNVAIHYRASGAEARALAAELNRLRPDSAVSLRANLLSVDQLARLAQQVQERWGRLDLLVNNASSYYETPVGSITEAAFDDLIGTNLKAPLFLAQACAPALRKAHGAIVNVSDLYARKPLRGRAPYCAAKAGLEAITRVLALELAPEVRVNAVAPSGILWPSDDSVDEAGRQEFLARLPAGRLGGPEAIADAVLYLAGPAAWFVTGTTLAVDGGEGLL
ncbi:MAG: pteridine reductase [Nevskia sp.]|nr:pteridine reductase [Nevskia sp.]